MFSNWYHKKLSYICYLKINAFLQWRHKLHHLCTYPDFVCQFSIKLYICSLFNPTNLTWVVDSLFSLRIEPGLCNPTLCHWGRQLGAQPCHDKGPAIKCPNTLLLLSTVLYLSFCVLYSQHSDSQLKVDTKEQWLDCSIVLGWAGVNGPLSWVICGHLPFNSGVISESLWSHLWVIWIRSESIQSHFRVTKSHGEFRIYLCLAGEDWCQMM